MYYRQEYNNIKILIKAAIKFYNKPYKLVIKIYYNNTNRKTEFFKKNTSYYKKKLYINR